MQLYYTALLEVDRSTKLRYYTTPVLLPRTARSQNDRRSRIAFCGLNCLYQCQKRRASRAMARTSGVGIDKKYIACGWRFEVPWWHLDRRGGSDAALLQLQCVERCSEGI